MLKRKIDKYSTNLPESLVTHSKVPTDYKIYLRIIDDVKKSIHYIFLYKLAGKHFAGVDLGTENKK